MYKINWDILSIHQFFYRLHNIYKEDNQNPNSPKKCNRHMIRKTIEACKENPRFRENEALFFPFMSKVTVELFCKLVKDSIYYEDYRFLDNLLMFKTAIDKCKETKELVLLKFVDAIRKRSWCKLLVVCLRNSMCRTLKIDKTLSPHEALLYIIFEHCKCLKYLSFLGCYQVNPQYASTFGLLSQLEDLELGMTKDYNIEFFSIILNKCPQLKTCDYTYFGHAIDLYAKNYLRDYEKILQLIEDPIPEEPITDRLMLTKVFDRYSTVEILNSLVTLCPFLQYLNLSSPLSIYLINDLPHLDNLTISNFKNLTMENRFGKKLRRITLHNGYYVNITQIIKNHRKLEYCKFYDIDRIEFEIFKNANNTLRNLIIDSCDGNWSNFIQFIIQFKNLRRLEINEWFKFTDDMLLTLKENKVLDNLEIFSSTSHRHTIRSLWVLNTCEHLERVMGIKRWRISKEQLESFKRNNANCPFLNSLEE